MQKNSCGFLKITLAPLYSYSLCTNEELTKIEDAHRIDCKACNDRYWQLYREAIEAYVKALEANENGKVIHSLACVVRLRENDLDRMEGK